MNLHQIATYLKENQNEYLAQATEHNIAINVDYSDTLQLWSGYVIKDGVRHDMPRFISTQLAPNKTRAKRIVAKWAITELPQNKA